MNTPVIKAPKYLVCVDRREESFIALRLACMKARIRKGSVLMLHVIPPADFQTLGGIADRMREERQQEGEQLLSSLCEKAEVMYGIRPQPILREGSPGDEIVAVALSDAEIIMVALGIATQHPSRGKLASWLATQLGHKLYVPLLMVPGNLTDQQLESVV